jgi:hypothetical protein
MVDAARHAAGASRLLADYGQRSDVGTVLIMIGFGLTAGLLVFLARMRGLPATSFKMMSLRFSPWLVGLGLVASIVGLAIHHY